MCPTTLCYQLWKNGWTDRFAVWIVDSGGLKEAHIQSYLPDGANGRAHWGHLANRIEPSVCGGDAALCQITWTACYFCCYYYGRLYLVTFNFNQFLDAVLYDHMSVLVIITNVAYRRSKLTVKIWLASVTYSKLPVKTWHHTRCTVNRQELIRRWDSERELLYDDNIHVEASVYAHWTALLISTFYYKYLW